MKKVSINILCPIRIFHQVRASVNSESGFRRYVLLALIHSGDSRKLNLKDLSLVQCSSESQWRLTKDNGPIMVPDILVRLCDFLPASSKTACIQQEKKGNQESCEEQKKKVSVFERKANREMPDLFAYSGKVCILVNLPHIENLSLYCYCLHY